MDRIAPAETMDHKLEALRVRVAELEVECCALHAALADAVESSSSSRAGREAQVSFPRHDDSRFGIFADALPLAIAYIDREQRYRFVNRTFGHWIGAAAEQIQGVRVSEIVGAETYRELEPHLSAAAAGEVVEFERTIRCPKGELRLVRASYVPDRDQDHGTRGLIEILSDLTESRRTKAELESSQVLYETAAHMARLGHFIWDDIEQRSDFCSEELARITGMTVETYLEKYSSYEALLSMVHADDRGQFDSVLSRAFDERAAYEVDFRVVLPDGALRYFREHGEPVLDKNGRVVKTIGIQQDITEHKLAELSLQHTKSELDERVRMRTAELRETNRVLVKEFKVREQAEAAAEQSRELLAQAVEALDEGFVVFDADERLVLCNGKFKEFYQPIGPEMFEPGTRLEEVAGAIARHCLGRIGELDVEASVQRQLEEHRGTLAPRLERHGDGRWLRIGQSRLANGWNVGTRTDVTEMKIHEIDLAEQARSIGLLQRISTKTTQTSSIEVAVQACLDEVCAYTGWSVGQAYTLESDSSDRLVPAEAWYAKDPPRYADLRRTLANISLRPDEGLPGSVLTTGEPKSIQNLAADPRFRPELTGVPGGAPFALRSACAFPVPVGNSISVVLEFLSEQAIEVDEQIRGVMKSAGEQLGQMIERKLSEDAIKQSEQQLRRVIDLVPLLIFAKADDGRFTLANQAVADMLDAPVEDLIGKTAQDFLNPNEDSSSFRANDYAVISGQVSELVAEEEVFDRKGRLRFLRTIKVPFNQSGYETPVVLGVAMDITEQREKERQLQHVQKMDAVGKLTGGVAHDFNNLLFVIQGNLQLLEETVPESEELSELIGSIKRAAGLGADLTRSLLAFSRQQPLKPELLQLGPVIEGSISLLSRTLAEDIQIETHFDDPIWPVRIDRYQLENAIINLAVNARDAMVDGGNLQVTIENTHIRPAPGHAAIDSLARPVPGDYVKIEVSDCGSGMPAEVIEQAFEPFFTTKRAGAGTGLGLSMVYGFVTQSGGHIEIESAVGEGTSIIILLPKATGTEIAEEDFDSEPDDPVHPRATILVTEDDQAVRRVAVKILKRLGYHTLEAKNGQEALALLDSRPDVSLLFTDVIMPGGMNGRQLAEEARRRRPDVKVLFSSGYSQTAIIRDGKLEDGVELITKPYQSEELARRLNQVLN